MLVKCSDLLRLTTSLRAARFGRASGGACSVFFHLLAPVFQRWSKQKATPLTLFPVHPDQRQVSSVVPPRLCNRSCFLSSVFCSITQLERSFTRVTTWSWYLSHSSIAHRVPHRGHEHSRIQFCASSSRRDFWNPFGPSSR